MLYKYINFMVSGLVIIVYIIVIIDHIYITTTTTTTSVHDYGFSAWRSKYIQRLKCHLLSNNAHLPNSNMSTQTIIHINICDIKIDSMENSYSFSTTLFCNHYLRLGKKQTFRDER